jgi:hypothetical protein
MADVFKDAQDYGILQASQKLERTRLDNPLPNGEFKTCTAIQTSDVNYVDIAQTLSVLVVQ